MAQFISDLLLTSKTKKNLFILTIGFVVFVVWIFLIIWSTSKGKEQREQQKIFEKTEKEKVLMILMWCCLSRAYKSKYGKQITKKDK